MNFVPHIETGESEGNWLNEGVALPRTFTSQLKCQPRARKGVVTPKDLLIVITSPQNSQMQLITVSYICENKTLNCFFCCSIFYEKLLYLKVEFGGWQDCSVGRGTYRTVWWSDFYPWNFCGGRKEPRLRSCLLAFTYMLKHIYTHTHKGKRSYGRWVFLIFSK